jgi:hypothetical protein
MWSPSLIVNTCPTVTRANVPNWGWRNSSKDVPASKLASASIVSVSLKNGGVNPSWNWDTVGSSPSWTWHQYCMQWMKETTYPDLRMDSDFRICLPGILQSFSLALSFGRQETLLHTPLSAKDILYLRAVAGVRARI